MIVSNAFLAASKLWIPSVICDKTNMDCLTFRMIHLREIITTTLSFERTQEFLHETISISIYISTLTLLEPKAFSLCHQCRARPACTSVQSDQAEALYCCWLTNFKFSSWYPYKSIMESSEDGRRIIPVKNFSRWRVNTVLYIYIMLVSETTQKIWS